LQQLGPNNPVVKPSQYINTLKKIAEMAGFKDTDQFFSSGEQVDQAVAQMGQQEGPSPEQAKAEAELELKREKMQAELQLEREKMQAEIELRRQELQAELQLRQQKLAFGGQVSDNLPRA
jgi:C4-dicarboxylate-specific signal transduction histidine kinase